MIKKNAIYRKFTSAIDEALNAFNQTHAPSPAQQAEIDKYRRIHAPRDDATPPTKNKDMWDFDS